VLNYQLFSNLINKPLLINVDASLTMNELSKLHRAGVKGLILPGGNQVKVITELKKKLAELPKNQKLRSKTDVLIPRISPQPEIPVEKVDDDEEDD
jgi:hypothetical protein